MSKIIHSLRKVLKNRTTSNGFTEVTYEVRIKQDNTSLVAALSELEGVEYATVVEFTGDYCE